MFTVMIGAMVTVAPPAVTGASFATISVVLTVTTVTVTLAAPAPAPASAPAPAPPPAATPFGAQRSLDWAQFRPAATCRRIRPSNLLARRPCSRRVGLALQRSVGVDRHGAAGVRHAPGALLDDVCELMPQDALAGGRVGLILPWREVQVAAPRVGQRADGLRLAAAVVDAHVGEVVAERGLHPGAHGAGERRTAGGRPQHAGMHGGLVEATLRARGLALHRLRLEAARERRFGHVLLAARATLDGGGCRLHHDPPSVFAFPPLDAVPPPMAP
jgi:hypothetical protein